MQKNTTLSIMILLATLLSACSDEDAVTPTVSATHTDNLSTLFADDSDLKTTLELNLLKSALNLELTKPEFS